MTFNVRTSNRIGQLPEQTASAIDHNVDIVCIQEHRYTYNEDIKYHDTGNASAWKNSALKSLNNIEKIEPRVMVATCNGNPSATIISCYSPINVILETHLITFYNELSSFLTSIPKHDVLVIGGEINAQIGENVNHKFSLHNSSNRNGEHLTDFTLENKITYLNTKFQKRKGKLWTNSNANNTKTQIDYVFIKKKWNNCALNCETYSSFEGVSSDHWIITAKIRLSLRRNAARTTTTVHYEWSLLYNRDIRDK